MRTIWIGIAGFAGAVSRYAVEGWVSDRTRGSFPWGTLMVNASGCFLLGLIFALLTERWLPHPTLRSALTVGYLGAYTTFSTFAYESVRLAEDGAWIHALGNVAGSLLAGLVAVYAGLRIGRAL